MDSLIENYNYKSYSLVSLTTREISLAAGWGLPHDDLAPLKHMITDLSEKLGWQQDQKIDWL